MFGVAPGIAFQLGQPVIYAGLRHMGNPAVFTLMLVPEAAMNKDHLAPGNEGQVRLAGQVFAVQPKTVTERMHHPAHQQFWPRAKRARWKHHRGAAGRNSVDCRSPNPPFADAGQHNPFVRVQTCLDMLMRWCRIRTTPMLSGSVR